MDLQVQAQKCGEEYENSPLLRVETPKGAVLFVFFNILCHHGCVIDQYTKNNHSCQACHLHFCAQRMLSLSLSNFATILDPQKNTVQEVGPPPISHLHSHTVKPEPQEVVLHSILSGQTNYSPFWKMHLSFSPMYFPSPSAPCLSSSRHLLFSLRFSRENGHADPRTAGLPVLSQAELRSDPKWAAVVAAQAPKFREIFSCGVPSRPVVFLPTLSPERFCGIS